MSNPQLTGASRKLGSINEQTAASIQELADAGQKAPTAQLALVPLPKVSVDPLDPVQLQNWVLDSSGLLKVRPPMPPAASGYDTTFVIPFQILSWYPRIVVFPGFLDKARAEHVVALASKYMYPSGLAYR
jgi:prolyl 4-hydroxylase